MITGCHTCSVPRHAELTWTYAVKWAGERPGHNWGGKLLREPLFRYRRHDAGRSKRVYRTYSDDEVCMHAWGWGK